MTLLHRTGILARHGIGLQITCSRACALLVHARVTPALGIWWTRRKPHPDRLGELCATSDVLVLRAELTLPGSCRDTLVLRPADFERGGAAEVFKTPKGWRVVWSQPIRGQRPWTGYSS